MQYTKMQKGLGELFSSFANGNSTMNTARADALTDLYRGQNYRAQMMDNMNKAQISGDMLKSRQLVNGDSFGDALPTGLDPQLVSTLLRSSDMSDPNALMDMIGTYQTNDARDQSMQALQGVPAGMDLAAAYNAIAAGNNMPDMFSQNAAGQVLNNFTGNQQTSPLSQSYIQLNNAKTASEPFVNAGTGNVLNTQTGGWSVAPASPDTVNDPATAENQPNATLLANIMKSFSTVSGDPMLEQKVQQDPMMQRAFLSFMTQGNYGNNMIQAAGDFISQGMPGYGQSLPQTQPNSGLAPRMGGGNKPVQFNYVPGQGLIPAQ